MVAPAEKTTETKSSIEYSLILISNILSFPYSFHYSLIFIASPIPDHPSSYNSLISL